MPAQERADDAAPIWARLPSPKRKPRFDARTIAHIALSIVDADGIDALSMRRLADELGVTPMSVYHYVRNKHDLLVLMEDEILAELLDTEGEQPPGTWRHVLAEHARRLRRVWQRRPWAILSINTVHLGPNGLRAAEHYLAGVAELPLASEEKMELLRLVQQYVLGFVMYTSAAGAMDANAVGPIAQFLASQLATGEFPHMHQALGADVQSIEIALRNIGDLPGDDDVFERGLNRLLDGIEADLDPVALISGPEL